MQNDTFYVKEREKNTLTVKINLYVLKRLARFEGECRTFSMYLFDE